MSSEKGLTKKQQKLLGILAIVLLILVMAALFVVVGGPLVRFASDPDRFRAWVESHGIWGPIMYMGMVFIQVVVAIIPGEPVELVGGYAFGALEGTVLCLAAATLASVLVFLLVRKFGIKLVEVFFSIEKIRSLRFLKSSPARLMLFMVIFMMPGTPKDLLCYFAGLTDMKFGVWLLICSLGRIPSVVTSTIGGDALGTEKYVFAVIVFAVTFLISGIGLLVYNRICKRNSEE